MEKDQLKVDDWMCERLNRILNELNEKTAPDINTAIGKMSTVMMLANRLRPKDEKGVDYANLHFDDSDRSNFDYRIM